MKVLRSIKPYWVYLICEGIKTIEVGKSIPRSKDWDKGVAIYCSKNIRSFRRIPKELQEKYRPWLGKVIGEFVCYEIIDFANHHLTALGLSHTCLTLDELNDYLKGKDGFGWTISDLKIYDKPKELGEFGLTRPPQSWCYVEELC